MSVVETDIQRRIVERLNAEGHYAYKGSASATLGLPDLYCWTSGNQCIPIEVKFIKGVPWGFNRTVEVRPKQADIAGKIGAVGSQTVLCAVFKIGGTTRRKNLAYYVKFLPAPWYPERKVMIHYDDCKPWDLPFWPQIWAALDEGESREAPAEPS